MTTTAGISSLLWDGYRSAIGRRRHALTTPALLLDLPAVRSNIARMAAFSRGPTKLRPHAKSHKSVELARMQSEAGVVGFTNATVWEVEALAAAGLNGLLLANVIVDQDKIRRFAEVARNTSVLVSVDSAKNAEDLAAAARAVGSDIGLLIEIDVGLGRCGARTEEEARELARQLSRLKGVRLRGVMGYEGQWVLEPNRETRAAGVQTAMQRLMAFAEMIRADGWPIEIVSAGGTGTYDMTGSYPGITELQAGSYVFTDAARLEIVPEFAVGLTVLGTVISRHGSRVVVDAGKKAVGADYADPRIVGETVNICYVAEEHTVFDVNAGCGLEPGQKVEIIPGYAPLTINLHDVFYVVDQDQVVDVWPIIARGPGQGGVGFAAGSV